MANTYSQIYLQFVFAVKGRASLIPAEHREELHKYLTGIVQNRGQKLLAVFCMPNHTHLLVGFKPSMVMSDLIRDVKAGTSQFLKKNGWANKRFAWQEGYGVFSYSRSQIDTVIKYINNQEAHHRKRTFKEEYTSYLKARKLEFDEQYLFDWVGEE